MIGIKKDSPPEILLQKQKEAKENGLNPNDSYKLLNSSEKKIVLESLMKEQGHLCAYCMRRIPDERKVSENIPRVTIEHWLPRNTSDKTDVEQGLDYNNLFAVCSGNRGKRGERRTRDLTCDAKRSSSYAQLTLNPLKPDTLSTIQYKENGEMFSEDKNIMDDIKVKLNLNCISDSVQLPQARKSVLDAMISEIPAESLDSALDYCKDVLDFFENESDPKTEYVGILLWWLNNYIKN